MSVSVGRMQINDLFFFNDTATTEIYTLSLHDALPISPRERARWGGAHLPPPHGDEARGGRRVRPLPRPPARRGDRKSTRLNSSHANISYAVFCLKKKKTIALPPRCALRLHRHVRTILL